ncbi:MAG: hypothetical protein EXS17_03015 [Phycisphaerales bacterium]|nr:hypothetical protein [Phycisphaerales bacterium]
MKTFALLGATALITSTASAAFTNLSVTVVQNVVYAPSTLDCPPNGPTTGPRNVYSIYANFTVSNDRILSVFDYWNVSGTMNALHNDNAFGDIDTDGDGYADIFGMTGSWSPTLSNAAGTTTDSFVVIGTPGPAALDPGLTYPYFSAGIANGSGWHDSTPSSQNLAGTTLKIKVLQIARLAAGETAYTGRFNVGYAAFGTTTPLFGVGQFTIPAPGAIALLGFAGLIARRRRN